MKEIRNAYREILTAYNVLFPLSPNIEKGKEEALPNCLGIDEESTCLRTMKALKKAHDGLKEAADRSGNVRIWRSGEPLEGFPQSLKERIELALRSGI